MLTIILLQPLTVKTLFFWIKPPNKTPRNSVRRYVICICISQAGREQQFFTRHVLCLPIICLGPSFDASCGVYLVQKCKISVLPDLFTKQNFVRLRIENLIKSEQVSSDHKVHLNAEKKSNFFYCFLNRGEIPSIFCFNLPQSKTV